MEADYPLCTEYLKGGRMAGGVPLAQPLWKQREQIHNHSPVPNL